MKHLKKYNEESFWNAFKIGKSMLYDKSRNLSKKSPNTEPYKFYSIKVPSIKLIDEYATISFDNSLGTFIENTRGEYSFRKLGDYQSIYSDELWFDAKPVFDTLHKIGDKLGYKIGANVSCKSMNKDTKITEILDFAFYQYASSPFTVNNTIHPVWTLMYKLEGSDNLHQVIDIDLIDSSSKGVDNIVDDAIKENFYELIDDNTIEYVSNKKKYKNNSYYDCSLKLNKKLTPDLLFKVSEALSIAEKRLKDQGIILSIKKLNQEGDITSIRFICHGTEMSEYL